MYRLLRIALTVLVIDAGVTPAEAQNRFWLVNATGTQINEAYVSPSRLSEWGPDILGAGVLPAGQQVWVTPNGTMGRSLTLLKGSRSGAAAIRAKGKQLTVRLVKAARLPVAVVLPVKGLSAKKTYVLRMRTINASGPLAQVDLGFRTAAPPVAARAAAR